MPTVHPTPAGGAGDDQVGELLGTLSVAASALVERWPVVEGEPDAFGLRWSAVALAELIVVLLRGDGARAVELADLIAESCDAGRTVLEDVAAGEVELCNRCGDDVVPGEQHRCAR